MAKVWTEEARHEACARTTDRATPRPWSAADTVEIGRGTCRPRIYGPAERIAGDVVDQLICVCDSQGLYHSAATSDEMDAEARANANLIVRAVNAHDALVEACKNMLHELNGFLGCCGEDEIRDSYQNFIAACDKADAALALAQR